MDLINLFVLFGLVGGGGAGCERDRVGVSECLYECVRGRLKELCTCRMVVVFLRCVESLCAGCVVGYSGVKFISAIIYLFFMHSIIHLISFLFVVIEMLAFLIHVYFLYVICALFVCIFIWQIK